MKINKKENLGRAKKPISALKMELNTLYRVESILQSTFNSDYLGNTCFRYGDTIVFMGAVWVMPYNINRTPQLKDLFVVPLLPGESITLTFTQEN